MNIQEFKDKVKKNLIKIGLDVVAIVVCAIFAKALPEFMPILQDVEIFVAVAAGIWLYVPIRNLIEKAKK